MRLIARYAKDLGEQFEIVTVFDQKVQKDLLTKSNPQMMSLAKSHPAAIWFERKIQDDFGIQLQDSFDQRPLLNHGRYAEDVHPMCKSFQATEIPEKEGAQSYPYEIIQGEGVFQVAVGPIHAGIIEPGHFHFSQAGEEILHLEVRHFYKYRAIEKMLEGKTLWEARPIIERISGNESIAYQIAWRDCVLAAHEVELPLALRQQHALLLELERLIHHLNDIGSIPNDTGFAAALAYGSKLMEAARRMMKTLTGHRFGFGAIQFTPLAFDDKVLVDWLADLEIQLQDFEKWIEGVPSLWDRMDTTGILSAQKAKKYDVVGVVARASGQRLDRRQNPFYFNHGFKLVTQDRGDVAARFKLRLEEMKVSIQMMRAFLDNKAQERDVVLAQPKDGAYMSFSESAIGELFLAIDIQDGVIERFYARDPSFINWQALHLMMPNDIIADFPLINKSCDLSYAGNDL